MAQYFGAKNKALQTIHMPAAVAYENIKISRNDAVTVKLVFFVPKDSLVEVFEHKQYIEWLVHSRHCPWREVIAKIEI